MDEHGNLWFTDWFSAQCNTEKGIEAFIAMLKKHKPMRAWNEGSLIDKAIGPAIRRRMRETQKFTVLETLPSLTDKASRLQSFHARASAGTIYLPANCDWAERLMDQLVKFPAGRYDDMADVCGLLGRGVDLMMDAHPLTNTPKPLIVPFTEKWLMASEFDAKPRVRYF
jgi:predicted phage terminase large subunit-like protein